MLNHTRRMPIDYGWRVREVEGLGGPTTNVGWIPAQVPGHVHLDLERAGVITDPFHRMAERSAAWVDETDWVYETTFHSYEAQGSVYLVFHGLDTVAEIRLNGERLGQVDNMFIGHEFPVQGLLRSGPGEAGKNTLTVVFQSALRVGRERREAWAAEGNDTLAPHWFVWGPRSFVRKAQYMYGWDWGPELVSCGMWQPVELLEVPTARILDWNYTIESLTPSEAVVRVAAAVERTEARSDLSLKINLFSPGFAAELYQISIPIPNETGRVQAEGLLRIKDPQLWTPNDGTGFRTRAPLYKGVIGISDGREPYLDGCDVSIGLRTVELVRKPDADGSGFLFRVNGQDVFMKGANWIPADSFPARLEADNRVRELIEAAALAGFNMLRVWGGGLYESEAFYNCCDELGILVWQDFPYGCAYYPDTGVYAEAARQEATAAVRRLRRHPSLAIWCGNNENHQLHHDGWSGRDNMPPRYVGEKIYHEVLPAVLEAEDPGRPYWPSSPYGGSNPNSQKEGDRHDWDVWHGVGDWVHYVEDYSRFVSEFGFASSCGLGTWAKCLAPADRSPYSPAVRWHDKTRKGYDTYLGYIRLHFPDPLTLEDLVYYSQLNQAEALKCALEHWRRQKGCCWGTLFWQINDCWPVQSWAVIDSEGEPKAAYYAVRRAYAPLLLSLHRRGGDVAAHFISDLPVPLSGTIHLAVRSFEGDLLAEEKAPVRIEANGALVAAGISLAAAAGRERQVFVEGHFQPSEESLDATPDLADYPATENILLLAEPKDLLLSDPGLRITIEDIEPDEFQILIAAERFAPYVWLRFEGLRGWRSFADPSDNFFHLRPGEEKRIWLTRLPGLETREDLLGKLTVRSLGR